MPENNNHLATSLPATPHPKLKALDRLVGTWRMNGPDVDGINSYEWMEGGFFLIHHFDLVNFGERAKGIEYVGHDVDTDELVVRLMGTDGARFHYVWELIGDAYNAWLGDRGADIRMESRFTTADRIDGAWHWPGGGATSGYAFVMDRIAPA